MNAITWIHVAGGVIALVSGTVAVAVRTSRRMHVSAGCMAIRSWRWLKPA